MPEMTSSLMAKMNLSGYCYFMDFYEISWQGRERRDFEAISDRIHTNGKLFCMHQNAVWRASVSEIKAATNTSPSYQIETCRKT